jgi:hypothetical protein
MGLYKVCVRLIPISPYIPAPGSDRLVIYMFQYVSMKSGQSTDHLLSEGLTMKSFSCVISSATVTCSVSITDHIRSYIGKNDDDDDDDDSLLCIPTVNCSS